MKFLGRKNIKTGVSTQKKEGRQKVGSKGHKAKKVLKDTTKGVIKIVD